MVRPLASSNESYSGWGAIAIQALLARMTRAGHRVPAWSHDPAPVGRHGGMIDTIRREEACDAILDLARRHLFSALTPEETQELVDSRRDF
jgi:hypothetical protein